MPIKITYRILGLPIRITITEEDLISALRTAFQGRVHEYRLEHGLALIRNVLRAFTTDPESPIGPTMQ